MKYTCPTHYQPYETVTLDDLKPGMKTEIHMRTGKHAGKEFYFDIAGIYTDHIMDTVGLIVYKRDLVKGNAEIRNRAAQKPAEVIKDEAPEPDAIQEWITKYPTEEAQRTAIAQAKQAAANPAPMVDSTPAYSMVQGDGAPQYTFAPATNQQLALF